MRETLERCLAAERPYGTYDDTRAGHDAFSRGLVDDYDHGNHHLARATICPADPGLVTCAGLSALDVPDADADADAPIIDELARASDPNLIASVLADAACWTLTGTPLGEVCVTRASEPPSWSRHQTNSAWPTPSMPSPRPARHDRSPRTHRRPPLPRSAIFCAPRATGSPHVKRNDSVRPSWQMRRISVSTSPTFTGQVREVFHQATPGQGRRLAAHLIQRLPACPIPEIARLGRTLRKWKDAFDAYFDTDGASSGSTEAINGIIELGRRIARGYRNPTSYQLRMLLIAGGLDAFTHTQL